MAGVALLMGCEQVRYCRVVIEDPDRAADGADELVVLVDGVELSRASVSDPLPLTQVVARAERGEVAAVVEAWGSGAAMARASVTLIFSDQVETVTARLGRACDEPAACDDGVFANGDETCQGGICVAGQVPCVAAVACMDVVASEELRACVVTLRHERCEPITTGAGDVILTYCDAVAGCLPGEACAEEGVSCPQTSPCDATRICTSGRCVPSGSVAVDDDNPCTLDLCDPVAGVVHLAPDTLDGNSCALAGGLFGICLDGACETSRCGDGFRDVLLQEECDQGAANSDTESDRCRSDCTAFRCGDEVVDLGEECDDGNASDQDGCLATCRLNVCGDGVVNVGIEECDDGNFFTGDSCLPGCVANVCGDGVRDFTSEDCDDGNTLSFDGCSGACDFVAWQADLGGPIAPGSAPIAWTENTVDSGGNLVSIGVVGAVTASGSLVVLDRASGVELWRHDAGEPVSSSPAAGAHGVYFVTDPGVVHGNALAGPLARAPWTFVLAAPANGAGLAVSSGPVNDAVIAVDQAARLYHLKATGLSGDFAFLMTGSEDSADLRSYEPLEGCSRCVPTAIGDLTPNNSSSEDGLPGLIVPGDTGIWGWDLANHVAPMRISTERVVSQIAFRGFYGRFATNWSGFFAYFTASSGALHGVMFGSGPAGPSVEARASITVAGPFVATPIVTIDAATNRDALLVTDDAGSVYRYVRGDLTGSAPNQTFPLVLSPRWPAQLDAPISAPLAMGFGGTLFAADSAGHVHALDELSALELWSFDIGAPASGSPLPIDGAVFVATTTGQLFALERGTQEAPPTLWSRQGGDAAGDGGPPQCGHAAGAFGLDARSAAPLIATLLLFRRRRRPA